jgi:hypothetical protein
MAESEEKHREKIVRWKTNKDLKMNPGKTKVMIGLDVTERVKGPSGKWPYGICSEGVVMNSLECTKCDRWIHRRCNGVRVAYKQQARHLCARAAQEE